MSRLDPRSSSTRLLRAELRKLRRPLVYWTAVAVVITSSFLLWAGQVNSVVTNPPPSAPGIEYEPIPSCSDLGLPPGQQCSLGQQRVREAGERFRQEALAASRLAKAGQQPLGVGRFAAGLLASLVGAGALLLLAAGHVGGEWTGRTIKSILVQDGRRGRLLLAKVASLWLTGVALLGVTWGALALIAPYLAHKYGNPTVTLSMSQGASTALAQTARALLVLGVFSVIGVTAAVLTRNTLGTFFLGFGVVLLSQVLVGIGATARWSPAYWVTGWMGFRSGNVPADYLWTVRPAAGVASPTAMFGLVALVLFLCAAAAVAWFAFSRADVTA
jgi:ABC-type transport system involved in multi-copper enzyme maturation permease subunit